MARRHSFDSSGSGAQKGAVLPSQKCRIVQTQIYLVRGSEGIRSTIAQIRCRRRTESVSSQGEDRNNRFTLRQTPLGREENGPLSLYGKLPTAPIFGRSRSRTSHSFLDRSIYAAALLRLRCCRPITHRGESIAAPPDAVSVCQEYGFIPLSKVRKILHELTLT